MYIRNGIRSTLRARGRTALFTVLILILTVFLALGLGIFAYCARTLSDMDKNYTSIALMEYMIENYPESNQALTKAMGFCMYLISGHCTSREWSGLPMNPGFRKPACLLIQSQRREPIMCREWSLS